MAESRRTLLATLLALASLVPAAAHAVVPATGDFVVVNQPTSGGVGVGLVNGSTTAFTQITTNGLLGSPWGLCVFPTDGLIYVLNTTGVVRVDPCDGAQLKISSHLPSTVVNQLSQICAHSDGYLYYTAFRTGQGPVVTRVDRFSGLQTQVTPANAVVGSFAGITEGPDHELWAAYDPGGSASAPNFARITRSTGAVQLYGLEPAPKPRGIAFDSRDSLFIQSPSNRMIYRCDPATNHIVLRSYNPGDFGAWMTSRSDGFVYYTGTDNATVTGTIFRIDPVSGAQSVFKAGGMGNVLSIGVVKAFQGCPTPAERSTWGQVKTLYR